MKRELAEEMSITLLKNDFTVKNVSGSCFDILARKEDKILLIKVLQDANAISQEYAEEMKKIAAQITATPLIVAEKANEMLEDNIVYSRFGVYTLNPETLQNCIKNRLPFVKRTKAGLTATINSKRLAQLLEEEGLSLSEAAGKIGVSARMISQYQEGSEITFRKALEMHRLFGGTVFERINIFDFEQPFQQETRTVISKKYFELGFEALETRKVPFDIIARKNNEIILTEVGEKPRPELEALTRLLDAENLIIFSKNKPKDMPAINKKDFLELETAEELIRLMREF